MSAPVGQVRYCTREDVKRALDSKQTARNNAQVDREIAASTGAIEGLCRRRFYPLLTTRFFDVPDTRMGTNEVVWFDESDLIEATSVTLDGVELDQADYSREPVNEGPPFTRVRLHLSGLVLPAEPRVLAITGLWGYNADEKSAGTLVNAVDDDQDTVDVSDSTVIGVGSIIRIGTERMVVNAKNLLVTGQALQATVDAKDAVTAIPVVDGTEFTVDESITIDGESMLIIDIAGNTLIVKRAWDGSPLASHTSGAAIYAPRRLTVDRGVLGSTAASHPNSTAIAVHLVPLLVRQLAIAESITALLQEGSGYGRVIGTGDGQREAAGKGLVDLRRQTAKSYGRKPRREVMA